MFFKDWYQGPSYSFLGGSSPPSGLKNKSNWSRAQWLVLFSFCVLMSFALGYRSASSKTFKQSIGAPGDAAKLDMLPCKRQDPSSMTTLNDRSRLTGNNYAVEQTPLVFSYNRTFGEDSPASDTAWTQLIPRQGGYFSHPVIAPERSTFSVYHYLHCLVGNLHMTFFNETRQHPTNFVSCRTVYGQVSGQYSMWQPLARSWIWSTKPCQ